MLTRSSPFNLLPLLKIYMGFDLSDTWLANCFSQFFFFSTAWILLWKADDLSHSQLQVLFLLTVYSFSIFSCKECNQFDWFHCRLFQNVFIHSWVNRHLSVPFRKLLWKFYVQVLCKHAWNLKSYSYNKFCEQVFLHRFHFVKECFSGFIPHPPVSFHPQSLSLCNPMNYNRPGSSVHGILQARIQEWVAISSSGISSPPREWTHISCVSIWN